MWTSSIDGVLIYITQTDKQWRPVNAPALLAAGHASR
jgi:hypothetical protein